MSEALAIIGVIIFGLIAQRNLVWGVSLIIILLPSYLWRLSFLGLPTTFLELIVLALFIIWLLSNFKKINWSLRKKSFNVLSPAWRYFLVAWLVVSVIALAVNPTPAALGLWRAYWLEPLFFFLVFIYTIKTKQDYKNIISSVGILIAWLFIVSLYQYFTDWNLPLAYNYPNVKRLTSVFSYPNALALLVAPLSAYLAGAWFTSKDKLKAWWLGITALFGFILCYLAQSEGAMLAILFSLVIYLLFAKLYQKSRVATWLFILFTIIILPLTSYGQSFVQQVFNPRFTPPTTSLEIRSLQWQETWQLLQDHWLAGSGLAGYREAMTNYHQVTWLEIYLYPHNIFLNFWTELGLLGLLVFISLLVYLIITLKNLFNKKNQLVWPLTLAWLTWFIHGLVDVPYFKNDLSILFFILLALTIFATNFHSKQALTIGVDK